MSELEKAPTVGAFTEILASTRVPTAFFDALEGVVVEPVLCRCGAPAITRHWQAPTKDEWDRWQAPVDDEGRPIPNMGGFFCDRCEDVLAAAHQRLAEPGYFDGQGYWVSPTLRALRELEKAVAA